MSFNTALTVVQKNKLRSGSYAGDLQLTLCSNTVVFAGQVNSDLTTPTSWAQFNFNNVTIGAYTDVELDEVILIGTVNDIMKATYRGRIRKAPTASILYTSESSTDFAVGAYFWVIYSFDPTYKLSRPSTNDPATAVELADYDLTYAAPRACSVGLRTAYVGRVDPATNKLRVAFDVSNSYAVASGDSISSYLFTFKAATYTVVSGSLSTAVVTVDFNADTEQWGKLTITTANGQVKTRRFYVRAYGTNSQPDTGADETSIQISGDWSRGWTMSATYFTGVDSVLNRTFAVAWRENENYGGVAGALDPTNNIAFIGWLQREDDSLQSDPQYAVLSDAKFEFTGVGARMQRLRAQEVAIRINSSPSAWGDIVNVTPWRAIAHFLDRYSTITDLCDLDFSDKTNAYLFPDFGTQGGNLYSAVQGIAQQIGANLEFAPDGRIAVNISAEYLTNLGRAGLVTVLDLQAQDCFNIQRSMDPDPNVGVVDAVGASYNSATGQVSTYAALAPGHAQGEAAGSDSLQAPIIVSTTYTSAALIDLTTRAGNRFEVANNNEVLDIDHPDGFTFGIASRYELYTLTIDVTVAGPNGVSRIIYDTTAYWMLESVSYARPGNGATNVHHRYRRLTRIGDPGDDITQVAANQIQDQLPDLGNPAFTWETPDITIPDAGLDAVNPAQLAPPNGMIASTKGEYVIAGTSGHAYWLKNVITLKRPIAADVTPSDLGSYLIKALALDPFFTKLAIPSNILGSDNTNSAVWNTTNVAIPSPIWTKGANVSSIYNVLRATNVNGSILIYSPGAGTTWSHTWDFTQANGGFAASLIGTYSAGTGWISSWYIGLDNNAYRGVADLSKSCSSTTLTKLSVTYTIVDGTINGVLNNYTYHDTSAVPNRLTVRAQPAAGNGTFTDSWNGSIAGVTAIGAGIFCGFVTNGTNDPGGSVTITNITAEGTGADPFAGGGGGSSAPGAVLSTDRGATWGGVLTIGTTSPGVVGGFDVQQAGSNSFAASTGAVYRATTLGGAYSSYYAITGGAQAACIIVPWYNWAGARQTAAANPDIIVALTALDGSSRSLLWIEGGATPGTVHDLTPVAGIVFDNANCVTCSYQHHIAVFGKVSGVYKLYKTTNQGLTWTLVESPSVPTFIRGRRQDDSAKTSGANAGQLYMASSSGIEYSSKWGTVMYPRTMPALPIIAFDPLY